MSLDFAPQRRELARRRRESLARRTQSLPLVRRIDPAFFVLLGAGTLALLLFWSIWVGVGWRGGLFDPPLVRPLPDERILANVRSEVAARPFLSAAVHRGRLYVAQEGGELHRYDPATELWTSARPFAGDPPEIGDFVDLRSGCGTTAEGCADPRSLWALSAAGGLARLDAEGAWTAVFGETVFQDADGDRPSTEDLTSAALSGDGRWLLLGTRAHGVGLFDQERRAWVGIAADDLSRLPSPAVSHLRWWSGRFWIGGPEGLAFLEPGDAGARIGLREDLGGAVEDLEAGEALWVLESRRCVNDAELACVKLSRLTDPERAAEALVHETNRYPELDLEGLRVVQLQRPLGGNEGGEPREDAEEEVLVLAGRAGLYTYDPGRHTWKRHVEEPVSAHHGDDRGGLWAGMASEAVYVAGGRVAGRWSLPGERVRRLVPAPGGMTALTEDGNLWSLLAEGETAPVFVSSSSRFDPESFYDALALEDGEVLFRGRDGILIHDVLARSYRDVARGQLPGWLFDPSARFLASGRRLFAFLPPASSVSSLATLLTTDPDQMASGDYDEPGRVPWPVVATAPWDGEGLAMIAGDGSAYLARQQTLLRLTGIPARDLERLAWNDVALDADRLAVATDQGLRTYLLRERSWQDGSLRGTPVAELALASANGRASGRADRLRMRTADGRLAKPDPDDPFLIGDRTAWGLDGGGLTDALADRGQIYLAGEDQVYRYDPARRRLTRRWELASPARGPVRLAGVLGSGDRAEPLSSAGGRAYVGVAALDPDAGRVRGLSVGERYVWTVRETDPGGPLYLKGHFRNRPFEPGLARCLFRHPSSGSGRPLDAREVGPRLVAVATSRGLQLYSRDTRSWYEVRWRGFPLPSRMEDPGGAGGLLHRVGDRLVLWSEGATVGRLYFLSLSELTLPASCSPRAVVDVEPELVVEATAASFDETAGTAAWVLPDGTVQRRLAGRRVETVLAPNRGAPRAGDLKRVYRAGDQLVFTTGGSLAVYDLVFHRWSESPVVPPASAGALTDMDLAPAASAGLSLTATTASGAVYAGLFDPGAPREALRLTEVLAPRERRSGSLGAPPEDLLDVQWRLGKWAFVLPDRLAIYDPENRRWEAGLSFPGPPDPSLSLRQAVGLDVLVKDGGREWWIERDPLSRSTGAADRWARFRPGDALATAVDERARVWRLRPGGRVERCEPRGAEYACAVVLAAESADPVVAFEAGPGGAGLRALRRSGRPAEPGSEAPLTGLRVELEPRLPPAVDVGWLAWVREPEPTFRVATPAGPRTFSRRELLPGGRLLFEDVRAVLAGPGGIHAATPGGVWTFRGPTLALASRNPATFLPADLGAGVFAAHGRFYTPEASLEPAAGRLEPDPRAEHRVAVGSRIAFVERVREAAVEGRIETASGTIAAFDGEGLAWDRRRGVAHHPRLGLVLLTGAGIHPARIGTAVDGFDPGPDGRALSAGRLLTASGGRLYFQDGREGYLLTAEGWSRAAGAGAFDRKVVDTAFWSWWRRGGEVSVALEGGAGSRELLMRPGAGGWQWSFDRLEAAAFHRGRLHLLTGAFLEVTGENVGTGSLAELHPAPPADRLESLVPRPGAEPELYAWPDGERGGARRWNEAAARFEAVAPGEDPLVDRELVLYGPLRIALEGGKVVQELRVEDPRQPPASRRPRWQRFRSTAEGFPFDRVTAVGAVGGRLLVDSPAGLQVYPGGIDGAGLGDLETIYDLGGSARLGRPAADPRRFLVVAAGRCFEWNETLEPCPRSVESASLTERWRAESGLWRFTERGGRARGFYKDAAGSVSRIEAVLGDGRFPHDRLADLALCGDEAAGLWKNGWISVHRDRSLSLAGAASSEELAAGRPRELLCVRRGREVPGGRLEAGLYAGGAGGRYWRREGETWTVVLDPGRRRALAELQRPLGGGGASQQFGRLRLAMGSGRRAGAFAYQYQTREGQSREGQTREGQWIEIPWSSAEGRLAIDVIDDLRWVDGQLWAVGPAGITAFGIDGDGRLRLDPDELTWIREPPAPCRITDWEVDDGRAVVRCDHDGERLFAGRLEPGDDAGVFAPVEGPDPFAERSFVSERRSGYWDWRLTGRQGGRPGRIEARLRGEPLGLAGGRFDFDHLTSIALEAPGRVELVSAVGGWYRQAADGLGVRDLARPEVDGGLRAEEVTRVAVSRQGEERSLCVETRPGTAFLVRDGAVRASARECPEDLGSDAVWSYDRTDGRLRARAPGIAGGWAERGLAQGRLTDQIVLGLPVTGSGEPGIHHLVPTAAGVLRFAGPGSPAAVYAPEHEGLEAGVVPPVVYLDPEGRAVYVTETGVRDLESGEPLSGPSFQVPEEARLTAMEEETGGFLRLRWRRGDERGWSLVREGDYATVGENVLPLDATAWGRFVRGRMGWKDASSDLGLRLLSGGWQLFAREGNRSVELPWKGPARPLTVLAKGSRLFVVEAGELSEVRLDVGVEELFR